MSWPWDDVPGDDGYLWSLNMARMVCAGLLLFPVLFWLAYLAIMLTPGHASRQPLLVGIFAVLAVAIVAAAPYVRENTAQVGIGVHLSQERSLHRPRAVYAGFATASIAGFLIAQAPALFGFLATALTRTTAPLIVGSAASYVAWAWLWPRHALWERWTQQARVRADGE